MSRSVDREPARPSTPDGAKAFVISPFARLARTHAASAMGDAMVAASLAGSLFFTLPAGDARTPVLRYLVITMLPFALLSPAIGPLIDRMKGGHRLMVIASTVGRAAASYLMATQVQSESLIFFFYALCLLVFQKAYQVGRSALVPTVVSNPTELVEANSKLALLSGIAGFVGVIPAVILLQIGPEWSLGLAMVTYVVAGALATRIQPVLVAKESADVSERIELRGATIIMAGTAMGLIRASVGFLTLLIAFDFRGGDREPWQFALVGGVSVLSQLLGAAAGPRIRKVTSEENLLTGVLALVAVGGFLALLLGDVAGATVLGASIGFAAGGGKLAFDSILQRDAPDANRGRAFARFETRFQIMWVVGALVPVAVAIGARAGFVLLFLLATVALGTYLVARMAYAHRTGSRQTSATAAAAGFEDRMSVVSGQVKGRLAAAPRAAYRRMRTSRDPYADEYDDDAYEDDGYDEHGNFTAGNDEDYDEDYDEDTYEDHPDGEAAQRDDLTAIDGYDDRYDDRYDDQYGEVGPDQGQGDAGELSATVMVDDDPDHELDDAAFGDDPDKWVQPVWADDDLATSPAEQRVPDSAWAPPNDRGHLASDSSVAWDPEDDLPWEPPVDPRVPSDAYLDDVDPDMDNPFPWTPDGPTRRER
ncbi:MAG: MFS transporter [Aquihabitans sp.]